MDVGVDTRIRPGFWRRLAATWADAVVVFGLASLLLSAGAPLGLRWPIELVFLALAAAYGAAMLTWRGQTAGKVLLGYRVVLACGAPLTLRAAVMREVVGKWLLAAVVPPVLARIAIGQGWVPTAYDLLLVLVLLLPLFVHYLTARRTWYDRLAGCRVEWLRGPDPAGSGSAPRRTWYDRLARTCPVRAVAQASLGRHPAGAALAAGAPARAADPRPVGPDAGALSRGAALAALLLGAVATVGAKGLDWSRHGYLPVRLALYQDGRSAAAYVRFLRQQHTSPVDYTIGLFDRYDIVILCERIHPEVTQWDFIRDVVADPRFAERVGRVFTEYGTRAQQAYLDGFMAAPGLTEAEVAERARHLLRNPNVWPVWTNTNFYTYLTRLYRLNQALPPDQRIRHYLTDQPLLWDGLTAEGYQEFHKGLIDRDRDMAQLVIDEVRRLHEAGDPRPKALVVMNYRHAFRLRDGTDGRRLRNTAEYIYQAFADRSANVLLNTDIPFAFAPIAGGAWDAAFARLGNPPLGFDLAGTPFGEDAFDQFYFDPSMKYRHRYSGVFTGFIFAHPMGDQYQGEGIPDYFLGFGQQAVRRARLLGDDYARKIQYVVDSGWWDSPRRREMPYQAIQTLVEVGLLALVAPGLLIGLTAFVLRRA